MTDFLERGFFSLLHRVAAFVSFECLVEKRANGGDIILARSFFASLLLFMVAVLIADGLSFWGNIRDKVTWFGAIWVAIYFGFYTRFASQWAYIANLYNQIKATEIRALTQLAAAGEPDNESVQTIKQKIAEWKAAFIEDAETIHLATKKSIVPVVWFWLREGAIKEAYVATVPGGAQRYNELRAAVDKEVNRLGGVKFYESQDGEFPGR